MDGQYREASLPVHVALIMDGNSRWAKRHDRLSSAGHLKGAIAVRRVISHALKRGISFLTLFAFAYDNWMRPLGEVDYLMLLFRRLLVKELHYFHRHQVSVTLIGDIEGLFARVPALEEPVLRVQSETRSYQALRLQLAVNYSARREIMQAVQRAMQDGQTLGSTDDLRAYMFLDASVPDPDLLIRTSGEQRISDFLLWYLAYTELYFCPSLWPDFGPKQFDEALLAYGQRERRFGRRI